MPFPSSDVLILLVVVVAAMMFTGSALGLGSDLFAVGGHWLSGLGVYVLISLSLRGIFATFLAHSNIPVDPDQIVASIGLGAVVFTGLHMGIGRFFAWVPILGGMLRGGDPLTSAASAAFLTYAIAVWPYMGRLVTYWVARSVGWPWW